MSGPDVLAAAETALGNGTIATIRDIVYLKPAAFDAAQTRAMAAELEAMNRELVAEGRPYLLIGFGRWGTSDPWLGVPVLWSQISGARAIVESSLPDIEADPSQGSHFFHNVTGFPRALLHREAHGAVPDRLGLARPPAGRRRDALRAAPAPGGSAHREGRRAHRARGHRAGAGQGRRMNPSDRPIEDILRDLQERAKELECLYQIEELLLDTTSPLADVFAAGGAGHPHGLAVPAHLPGAHRLPGRVLRRAGLRADPVRGRSRRSVCGTRRSARSRSTTPRRCRRPTRGRSSRRNAA